MKLSRLVLSTVAAATLMATGASAFDAAGVFEKDCQGCHGPAHQGGVGADLRPNKIKNKSSKMLANTILNGRAGTAMVPWKKGESIGHEFTKADADAMVKYLKNFTGKQKMVLTLENVKKKWRPLNDRMKLFKKKTGIPVAKLFIMFLNSSVPEIKNFKHKEIVASVCF